MARLLQWGIAAVVLAGFMGQVKAATVTVAATDNVYDAGQSTPISTATLPVQLSVTGGATVNFSNVTGSLGTGQGCAYGNGCIEINQGTGNNLNDPDGIGAASASSHNNGTSSLSGITAPNAGYLVGVFVAAGGPSGAAPTALDFTSGTTFGSLSPVLDQVFFIGDGLTGDGSGSVQDFIAPSGAASLYLGLSDACNYNGPPGCFGDNVGSYSLTVSGASPMPEPFSLALLAPAAAGVLLVRRRYSSARVTR